MFSTSVLFVLPKLTHDALCFAPLPTFGSWLGQLCFNTTNKMHQGSLGGKPMSPFSSRPEFICLVHTRVWMSFHTTQNVPNYPRKWTRVPSKWTKQLWCESNLSIFSIVTPTFQHFLSVCFFLLHIEMNENFKHSSQLTASFATQLVKSPEVSFRT